MVVALKTFYFLAQKGMPISKHSNKLDFLGEINCPHVEHLKCTKTVTYESGKAGAELISSIASVIRKKVDSMMIKSPYISFLLDASTDLAKKLVVYALVIYKETYTPTAHFVPNIKVRCATGVAIYNELRFVMNTQSRVIPPSKVLGLGTDGAKVMTGSGKGLTGFLLDVSTYIATHKKLAVYACVIDMKETFTPSTHFVTNMKIESATGVAIYNELKYIMNKQNRVIPHSKVLDLETDGADGAKVMTGYMTSSNL